MSHWAELDADNKVMRVLVGSNEGDEGKAFFESLGGVWVKCSYNGNIRKNFPNTGFTYDEQRDAFIAPKANCHPEEALNEALCRWECHNEVHYAIKL
jgi:hypothetical protein